MITEYYSNYYSRLHRSATESELVRLLTAVSQKDLSLNGTASDILYSNGWLTYHTYLVIAFSFLRRLEIGFSTEYFCSKIEDHFGNCISFDSDGTVWCVVNTSFADEASLMEKLPYFLRDNLCRAGISNPCSNFFTLHTYFSQARQALMLGLQTDPHFWYFRFSDYTFQYIMMQNVREYERSQIIHPALGRLKRHDMEKHTDYYRTLRCYLENNMNASRTAEQMFIHRSTLLQRLEQIEKITKTNLKDMKERTYLQLSFLLDEEPDSLAP